MRIIFLDIMLYALCFFSSIPTIIFGEELISGLTTHRNFLPVDFNVVTGAQIDESIVEVSLYIDVMAKPCGNGSREKPFQTIAEALEAGAAFLKQGKPTRVVIQPGTYREGELNVSAQGKASQTLLVIEAAKPGRVVISGSDIYAPDTWEPVMDETGNIICYEHPWPHDFGFNPGGWKQNNPKYPCEHRSELAFVNGKPLRQIMLEVYEYKPPENKPFPEDTIIDPYPGIPQDINKHGIYTYIGMTDPEKLPPGSFGIAERDENGNRIYLRPPEGIEWNKAKIEVSVRRYLLWSKYKSNLVLRGLIFQHCAGPIESYATVMIGRWWPEPKKLTNRNILIEDCTFRYNNNNQLSIRYSQDVTLHRCRALYGAYGGLGMSVVQNVLWEDTESSFNNWRVSGGWASGGVKIHNTLDMITRGHTAIGNDGTGLWYDVSCGNVLVDNLTAIGNRLGLDWEISRGLHVRNSVFSANRQASVAIVSGSQVLMEKNLLYGSPGVAHLIFQASDRKSNERVAKILGRKPVESYRLDRLVLRGNAIISVPQPDKTVESISHEGIFRPGFVPALFFQHHGNPDWFERFVREGVDGEKNLWYSPEAEAFGIRKIFSDKNWRKRGPRCVMIDFSKWQRYTGEQESVWKSLEFVAPDRFDFRLMNGSSADKWQFPAFCLPAERLEDWDRFRSADFHRADRRSDITALIVE